MAQYMITNGHGSYIRLDTFTNKYVPVRSIMLGDVWDQRHIAVNIMKNSLGKKDRRKYKIVEVASNVKPPNVQKTAKEIRKEKENFVKEVASREIGQDQSEMWSSGVAAIHGILKNSEERKKELVSELSEVDKEITDIKHYIEFTSLNAYQGWLACNMLKNRLKKRRRIKNELLVICALGRCNITPDVMEDIEKSINELGNRTYEPRVLHELFE